MQEKQQLSKSLIEPIYLTRSALKVHFASGSDDKTVRLWNLDLDDLLARGCAWARDYLKYNRSVKAEDRKVCDDVGSRR